MKKRFFSVAMSLLLILGLCFPALAEQSAPVSVFNSYTLENRRPSSPARFIGDLGYYFTVNEPVNVTALGAPNIQGTTGVTVSLYKITGEIPGKGTQAQWAFPKTQLELLGSKNVMIGGTEPFCYATLDAPAALETNTDYLLLLTTDPVSYNAFYEPDIVEDTASEIQIRQPVFADSATVIIDAAGGVDTGNSYGSPAFLFTKEVASTTTESSNPESTTTGDGETAHTTTSTQATSTPSQQEQSLFGSYDPSARALSNPARFLGELGLQFSPKSDVELTALGAPSLEGATSTVVTVYEMLADQPETNMLTPDQLRKITSAVVTVNLAQKDAMGFNYTTLPTPVKLQKGKVYVLTMVVDKDKYNLFYETAPGVSDGVNSKIDLQGPVYAFLEGTDNTVAGGANMALAAPGTQAGLSFGSPTFKFKEVAAGQVPSTGAVTGYAVVIALAVIAVLTAALAFQFRRATARG